MRAVFLSTVVLACAVTTVASGARTVSACTSGLATATTASYRMGLDIGKQEDMYMASEVKARHIKEGEIMLGGNMTMIDTPPKGERIYHLEVHVCTKAGVVVQHLNPSIRVGTAMLPAAIMVGIGETVAQDYHYGNDIILRPGARITVRVTVKGQQAVFSVTVPKL